MEDFNAIPDSDFVYYEDIKHYNRVNRTRWVRWEQLESDRSVLVYGIDFESGKLRVLHI